VKRHGMPDIRHAQASLTADVGIGVFFVCAYMPTYLYFHVFVRPSTCTHIHIHIHIHMHINTQTDTRTHARTHTLHISVCIHASTTVYFNMKAVPCARVFTCVSTSEAPPINRVDLRVCPHISHSLKVAYELPVARSLPAPVRERLGCVAPVVAPIPVVIVLLVLAFHEALD
jgi:hypothetical protein